MASRKGSISGSTFFGLKRTKSMDEEESTSPDGRKRITIACTRCRNRKIRCDGAERCSKCVAAKQVCHYQPVSPEENLAAREKKATAKASRPKLLRISTQPVRGTLSNIRRKRSPGSANPAGGEADPNSYGGISFTFPFESTLSLSSPTDASYAQSGLNTEGFVNPGPPVQQYYSYAAPSTSSIHSGYESDYGSTTDASYPATPLHQYTPSTDISYASPQNYFQVQMQSPELMQSAQMVMQPQVQVQHPALLRTYSTPYLQGYEQMQPVLSPPLSHHQSYSHLHTHSHSHSHSRSLSAGSEVAYPAYTSAQPAGLGLYLPGPQMAGAPSCFSPAPAYVPRSQPVSPTTSMSPAPLRLPPAPQVPQSYQSGPIDWSSRPLAPFAQSSKATLPPSPAAPTFSSSENHLTFQSQTLQTVRLDQVCSAV